MTAAFATPEADIPRDRWGRPMVLVPGSTTKRTAYTRCTTYVGCLEDTYNLSKWQMRMTALGMAERPDLLLAAAAHRDDKGKLNEIVEQALDAASAHSSATIGTALHALTERHDRGQALGTIPADYKADLDAYVARTAALKMLMIETFVVHDGLKIGGTFDRLVEVNGERYIADLKTGQIELGAGKIAMQLAVYANSDLYDIATGQRSVLAGVNKERAIVIHLPAGTGECRLYWVDIARGWEAVTLATAVRGWRSKSRDLLEAFDMDTATSVVAEYLGPIEVVEPPRAELDPITLAINLAMSESALTEAWSTHRDLWTPAHTGLAKQRKAQLSKGGTA